MGCIPASKLQKNREIYGLTQLIIVNGMALRMNVRRWMKITGPGRERPGPVSDYAYDFPYVGYLVACAVFFNFVDDAHRCRRVEEVGGADLDGGGAGH